MNQYLRFLYLLGLAGTGAFMPFLHVGMSVGTIWTASVLFLHIVFEKYQGSGLKAILSPISRSRPAILMLAFFILHILWLLGTENFDYALNDIRIKLPIAVFAIVCGILPPLSRGEIKTLMATFGIAVLLALLICVYKSFFEIQPDNIRDAAGVFISHIRFGLMSGMSIGIWLWFWKEKFSRFLYLLPIILTLAAQWHLGMVTGMVTSATSLAVFGFTLNKNWRWAISAGIAGALLIFAWFAYDYFSPKEDFASRRTHSKEGEEYTPNPDNKLLENGYYVWNHIAPVELETAWSRVSQMDPDSTDKRGNELKGTLIRHLTSLGLTKDAEGIAQLTPQQIKDIESGIASPATEKMTGMKRRLYELFFEWDARNNGANPGGNSLTQRVAFQQAAIAIGMENAFFGVGTGDVAEVFDLYYEKTNSKLEQKFRLRAHQQYLTVWVTFGIFGLIVFLWLLWWAPFRIGVLRHYLPATFILIASLSFLTEDTLETQAGATFFSWFYGLLIIAGHQAFEQRAPE